jgi:alpha-L-fucosidase
VKPLELDAGQPQLSAFSPRDLSWFIEARLGLFIHWGIYASAARHEQVQRREEMPAERYQRYFDHFDPDLFDPEQWADIAFRSGFRYFVITTKHEDGFCLWDSALTDFKVTRTPYGKDLLGPMVRAFRNRGLRVGFYHTQMDHHHEHFTIDDLHHLRNHPQRAQLNVGRDMAIYRRHLHGQVRELLTEFGPVDLMWFDGGNYMRSRKLPGEPWEGKCGRDWDEVGLLRMIRELQPDVLLNDRLGDGELPGSVDFLNYEQALPAGQMQVNGQPVAWESPQTFSGSWGYHRDEQTWKSEQQVLEMLIYCVSRGGNLLLNVGPTARGEFDPRAMQRLDALGRWMHHHGRAIYGCGRAPDDLPAPPGMALTWNPTRRRLYLHLLHWPATPGPRGESVILPWVGMQADRIEYAQLLHDASEVLVKPVGPSPKAKLGGWSPDTPVLHLPVQKPHPIVPVVELWLK